MSDTKIIVDKAEIKCNGDKNSPHPIVYLTIKNNDITCLYCGTKYILSDENKNDH